jgi:hypothetical protein
MYNPFAYGFAIAVVELPFLVLQARVREGAPPNSLWGDDTPSFQPRFNASPMLRDVLRASNPGTQAVRWYHPPA